MRLLAFRKRLSKRYYTRRNLNEKKVILWWCFIGVMCLFLQGCGKKFEYSAEEKKDGNSYKRILADDMTYVSKMLNLEGVCGEIIQCYIKNNNVYILARENEKSHIYKYSIDDDVIKEITKDNLGFIVYMYIGDDNEIACLIDNDNVKSLLMINSEREQIIEKDLRMLQGDIMNKVIIDSEHNVIVASSQIVYYLNGNLELVGEIEAEKNSKIITFARKKADGIVCVIGGEKNKVEDGHNHGDYARIYTLDYKKNEWGKAIDTPEEPRVNEFCIMDGEEYDFYYKDGGGVYGRDSEQGSWKKIFDARCSLLSLDDIDKLSNINQNKLIALDSDMIGNSQEIDLLVPKKEADLKDVKVITYAGYNVTNQMRKCIREFNKKHDDYRVEVKIYEDDDHMSLQKDIIRGNVPDILPLHTFDISEKDWIKKGVLEDLNPYYKKNGIDSVMIPSVYEAMKNDGKIYSVAPGFYVDTFVASKKNVGNQEGWDVDGMSKTLSEMGKDAILFDEIDKRDMLFDWLRYNVDDFIDWNSGKCYFDSEEFKSILKHCNEGIVTDSLSDEKYFELVNDVDKKLVAGQVLMANRESLDVCDVQIDKQLLGQDITYIGAPVRDKNGSMFVLFEQYGIYSGSDVKDEAWEILQMAMTEEYQKGMMEGACYPTLQNVFECKLQRKMATESYIDQYGNNVEPLEKEKFNYGDNIVVNIGPVSTIMVL